MNLNEHKKSKTQNLLKNPVTQAIHQNARRYRLNRVQEMLCSNDCAAILLFDPVNIRYATDTSNMQVWTLHNPERYALVFANGPVILWEFRNCENLHDDQVLVDEVRTAVSWSYFFTGERSSELMQTWAKELIDVLKDHGENNLNLAIDHADFFGVKLLQEHGINIVEGHSLMENARKIKSIDELELMRWSIEVCQKGIQRMYDETRPGITENELWAWLHFENIAHGGEWIETRLLSSGQRTNPWMQESSNKILKSGEMVCFDTDLIGPYGYCADISRTWTVDHEKPTMRQRKLYNLAYDQIHVNMELLKPGLSYKEFSDQAWHIPQEYYENRYCCIAHGVGMADEYPLIAHSGDDYNRSGYDGIFQENMVMCVESYIGEKGGSEGVRLEQQIVITTNGCEVLSTYPWEETWLL